MTEPVSHVEQAVAARIAAARVKIQAARERRDELSTARRRGLAARHARKLRNLAEAEQRHQAREADEPDRSRERTPTANRRPANPKETPVTTTVIPLGDDRDTTFTVQTLPVSTGSCTHDHGQCGRPGVIAVRNTIDQQRPTESSTYRITLCLDHRSHADRAHTVWADDARELQDPVKRAEFLASAGVTT